MRRWNNRALTELSIVLFLTLACGSSSGLTRLDLFAQNGARTSLYVAVADTPSALETGLSGRTSLPQDQGMLFVIEIRGPGFWMKDTLIPLSVAFISACGGIVDIQDMEPESLAFHDTEGPFKFGLEVNKGWFKDHGIGVGGQVKLPPSLVQAGCPAN